MEHKTSPETVRGFVVAAEEAARLGGAELSLALTRERVIEHKGETDLVTDADRAAEEAIVAFLQRRFPAHAILAEERGALPGAGAPAGYRWVLDPLDGTTNFAHGVPHYAVSVALEDGEGLLAGAILDPVRGELFSAGRGLGATLNGRPIHVSGAPSLAGALLATGFPYNLWTEPRRSMALFGAYIMRSRGIRRAGSAALDLAWLAAGRYDGFFELALKPWDTAAGALLVREAGGLVTRLDGGAWRPEEQEILAAGPALMPAMLEVAQATAQGVAREIREV